MLSAFSYTSVIKKCLVFDFSYIWWYPWSVYLNVILKQNFPAKSYLNGILLCIQFKVYQMLTE